MPFDLTTEVRQGTPLTGADGFPGRIRLNRRCEMVDTQFITQATLEGRLFALDVGTLTAPSTWTATATISGTKAAAFISVPAGTTIIPVFIRLYMEAFGSNAQFECMASIGTGGSCTSANGTLTTPTNLRTDAPNASTTSCYGICTANVYPTANISEFWRDGQQFAITKTAGSATASVSDPNNFVWKYTDGFAAPVIVGPGQLGVYQGSQAGTGFCQIIWVEYPSAMVA